MTPRPHRRMQASQDAGSAWRAVPLAGLTVALLAVVAFASGGIDLPGVGASGSSSSGDPSVGSPAYLVLLAVAAFAGVVTLVAAVFAGASWSPRRDARVGTERTRVPRWLGLVLLVAIAAFPVAVATWGSGTRGDQEAPPVVPGQVPPPVSAPPLLDSTATPWYGWTLAVALGIALGAIGVAVAVRRRTRRRPTPASDSKRAATVAGLDRTIDDLRRDPDPRHAVISAYAWMEDELSESGWARRPSSAPFEFLDDALRELAIPSAPARSLTESFEIARFSRQRIDPSMKERAIAALVEIRGSLREGSSG